MAKPEKRPDVKGGRTSPLLDRAFGKKIQDENRNGRKCDQEHSVTPHCLC
jgi:hypothetical protein